MGKYKVLADTSSLTREEWLSLRRNGIGGSDAAAILGVSKYKTPYSVWADKKGLTLEKDDTESMRQGRDLEDYVAQRFCESTGLKVRKVNRMLMNPDYPYALANIDRRVVGVMAGLECKTCTPFRLSEFDDGTYPAEYYVQCLHYLAVTGWEKWYIAVAILGTSFRVFEINRNDVEEDIEAVKATISEFWENHLIKGIRPDPDGLEVTTKVINDVYRSSNPTGIDLSELEEHFIERADIKASMLELKQREEFINQVVKLAMGEHEYGVCGGWKASWKPRKDGVRVFKIT